MTQPLTDDQLRQVVTEMILDDARRSAGDLATICERLIGVLDRLSIEAPENVSDATLARIGDLIAEADLTVDWPGDVEVPPTPTTDAEFEALPQLDLTVVEVSATESADYVRGWQAAMTRTCERAAELVADRDRYRDLAERTEQEHRRLEAERADAIRDFVHANDRAGELETELELMRHSRDQYRAVVERVRALADEHAEHVDGCGFLAAAILDALSAAEPSGVDAGTGEARSALHGDAEPADGAVAAEPRTVDLATVTWYVWTDPRSGQQHTLAPEDVDVVVRDGKPGPRVWALPDEPGPEVMAVRDKHGESWSRQPTGWAFRGIGSAMSFLPWWWLVGQLGPLTDATDRGEYRITCGFHGVLSQMFPGDEDGHNAALHKAERHRQHCVGTVALELVPAEAAQDAASGRTDPAEGEETHDGAQGGIAGAEAVVCGPCRRGNHELCGWDEQQPPHRCQCKCPTSASVDAGPADGAVAAEPKHPTDPRPFSDLRSTGLLWLINAAVFHPRGFALALCYDGGKLAGWRLLGDGSEPWRFEGYVMDQHFTDVEALFAAHRHGSGTESSEPVSAKPRTIDLSRVRRYVWTNPSGAQRMIPPDEIAVLVADETPTAPKPRVIAWDWKEQLPLDELRAALDAGLVHLHEVDTQSDECAIVLASAPMEPAAVHAAYEHRDEDYDATKRTWTKPEKCGRCLRPFDPTDTAWNGGARHQDSPWCRSCVDRCHESTDFMHECVICADPTERGEVTP